MKTIQSASIFVSLKTPFQRLWGEIRLINGLCAEDVITQGVQMCLRMNWATWGTPRWSFAWSPILLLISLNLQISAQALYPVPETVEAIEEAPKLENVSNLQNGCILWGSKVVVPLPGWVTGVTGGPYSEGIRLVAKYGSRTQKQGPTLQGVSRTLENTPTRFSLALVQVVLGFRRSFHGCDVLGHRGCPHQVKHASWKTLQLMWQLTHSVKCFQYMDCFMSSFAASWCWGECESPAREVESLAWQACERGEFWGRLDCLCQEFRQRSALVTGSHCEKKLVPAHG